VGETTYVVLSLVAKSALAWQIIADTLAGTRAACDGASLQSGPHGRAARPYPVIYLVRAAKRSPAANCRNGSRLCQMELVSRNSSTVSDWGRSSLINVRQSSMAPARRSYRIASGSATHARAMPSTA
jgi:hypothetical protein